jgi:A/G-specific adenine glycosylase
LITEQLLRKTTAEQVKRVYRSFFAKYSNPHKLATASLAQLRTAIRPLGIEDNRSKALKEIAQHIVKECSGRVPLVKEELLRIPHVGDYAASSVMTNCVGKPSPMVDRNVTRVFSRVFGLPLHRNERHNVADVSNFLVQNFSGLLSSRFNYTILDFAALVCRARNPRCQTCVFSSDCNFFQRQGTATPSQ